MAKTKRKFNDDPFAYHQEIELEIVTLTNLGLGLGRVPLAGNPEPETRSPAPGTPNSKPETPNPAPGGWVVMVAFALPGERVRARVFRNHKNYSEADLVEVLTPSPDRVAPRCALAGRCGGCQYQHLTYAGQLRWKQRQVQELLQHLAGVEFAVAPVIASPREFGYRSKITPHFAAPRGGKSLEFGVSGLEFGVSNAETPEETVADAAASTRNPESQARHSKPKTPNRESRLEMEFPIGFLRQGTRFDIVDVPRCEIATDAINARLTEVRACIQARAANGEFTRGATLLLREASGGVTTDGDAEITENISLHLVESPLADDSNPSVASDLPAPAPATTLRLRFLARDFFQNNPFILPAFTGYVREQAAAAGARFLVDAYCGSGLFSLSAAPAFERVVGIEISESSIAFAKKNAAANGISNATFQAGDAARIFDGLTFLPDETAVIIDPPRKGCDETFLRQLLAYGPRSIVYVSCDPATQMRDLRQFIAGGYSLTAVQPFDLFPQTRHLECVITLTKPVNQTQLANG